jgi:hypothetical protein
MIVPIRPSLGGGCTCSHPTGCHHDCHGHLCDPGEQVCSIEFLPDEGGLTWWGCAECTPGDGALHLAGCPADPRNVVSGAI